MSLKIKPKKIVDCIGLYCPEPIFRTRLEIDNLSVGDILEVIADDPAAEEDIKSFVKITGNELLNITKKNNEMHFLIKKIK